MVRVANEIKPWDMKILSSTHVWISVLPHVSHAWQGEQVLCFNKWLARCLTSMMQYSTIKFCWWYCFVLMLLYSTLGFATELSSCNVVMIFCHRILLWYRFAVTIYCHRILLLRYSANLLLYHQLNQIIN